MNLYKIETKKIIRRHEIAVNGFFQTSLSPDGKKVLLSAYKNGQMDLYVYHFKQHQLQQLTDDPYNEHYPSWHPDGQRIVYCGNEALGQTSEKYNLYMLHLDTKIKTPLTSNDARETHPHISSDGKQMVFISDQYKKTPNLYLQDLETKQIQRLTDVIGGVHSVSWVVR